MGARITLFNDGTGLDIEVVEVSNSFAATPRRIVLEPGKDPSSETIDLRKGDFLIIRVVE